MHLFGKSVVSTVVAIAMIPGVVRGQESLNKVAAEAQAALQGASPSSPAVEELSVVPFAPRNFVEKSGADCSGGIIYDDGSFEDGYRTTSVLAHNFVTEFVLPAGTNRLNAICTCWSRASFDTSVTYRLNVYAADGAGGRPGTLLGSVTPNFATPSLFGRSFFRVDIPGGLDVPTNRVYVGPAWSELLDDSFFICADENGPGGHPSYFGTDLVTAPTTPLQTASYRALGIRVEAEASSSCVPSSTALCLANGRFRVTATFQAPNGGSSGDANVVKLTDETGYLWFFSASNVETVVKVLNGCGLNQHYWVFAGGLTNVQTVITVTDTETGAMTTYMNPQSTPFEPIQDTQALATCP